MLLGHGLESLGAADHTDEGNAFSASGLELLDGEAGAATRGQHGIEQEDFRFPQTAGDSGKVGLWLGGLFTAGNADVGNDGVWNQRVDGFR